MEAKDIFFIIGIIATLIISSQTLAFGYRNRRNTLWDHLYKEQIVFLRGF